MFLTFIIILSFVFLIAILTKINMSIKDHYKLPASCIKCEVCGYKECRNNDISEVL